MVELPTVVIEGWQQSTGVDLGYVYTPIQYNLTMEPSEWDITAGIMLKRPEWDVRCIGVGGIGDVRHGETTSQSFSTVRFASANAAYAAYASRFTASQRLKLRGKQFAVTYADGGKETFVIVAPVMASVALQDPAISIAPGDGEPTALEGMCGVA